MENVITAAIIIFIILFASLTLGTEMLESQQAVTLASQAIREHQALQADIEISPSELTVNATGAQMVLENTGSIRLYDFSQWDIFVHWDDGSIMNSFHVQRLPQIGSGFGWRVDGIYLDAESGIAEIVEPDILNPGEELLLDITLQPGIGQGEYVYVVVVTDAGRSVGLVGMYNTPPQLTTQQALTITAFSTAPITSAMLSVTDAEQSADDLIYTIEIAPTSGILNVTDTFTQADIDAGNVLYTSLQDQADAFVFTVSDGHDTIGSYAFLIQIDNAPDENANPNAN